MSPELHGWDIHAVWLGTGGADVIEVRFGGVGAGWARSRVWGGQRRRVWGGQRRRAWDGQRRRIWGILSGSCSSCLGPGSGGGLIGWQQGSAHGSARDERQHPHQTRRTGADRVLLAADAAGYAGRLPVRLRHVQHRLRAELRPLPPPGPRPGLPGLRGLAGCGRRSDPGRAGRGPVRPQAAADHRRRHLRGRLDPVRRHLACLGPAHRAHADRGGHRRGLGHRHRLHRRVRAEEPARVADHAPAVDDHGRHSGRLHRGADHLRRLAGQRGLVRLAAGARPGRRAGPDRAGDALPYAGITAVAAAARQVRRGAQGHGHARRAGRQRGRRPARRGGGGTGRGRQPRVAAPGLDPRGAAGTGRGQRFLHLPADHRDQRAVVLRPAPARADLRRRRTPRWSTPPWPAWRSP